MAKGKTATPKRLTATRMRWEIVESSGSCWIATRGNFSARGKFVSARGKDHARARANDVARDFGRWRAAQLCFLCLAKSPG
jgi:hypothetical protein